MNIQNGSEEKKCDGWGRDCQVEEIPARGKTEKLNLALKKISEDWQKKIQRNLYDGDDFLSNDYEISEKLRKADAYEKKSAIYEKEWRDDMFKLCIERSLETDECEKAFYKKLKEKEKHEYAITLTLDAAKYNKSNDKDWIKKEMEKSAKKICTGKNILGSDWQMELTKQGTPHIHIYVKSKKFIKKQELIKKYKVGFIWKAKVKNTKAYLSYIAKERNINWEGEDPEDVLEI